jgi:hypothetical protein
MNRARRQRISEALKPIIGITWPRSPGRFLQWFNAACSKNLEIWSIKSCKYGVSVLISPHRCQRPFSAQGDGKQAKCCHWKRTYSKSTGWW